MTAQAREPGLDPVTDDEIAQLEAQLQELFLGRVGNFRLAIEGAGLVLRGYARTYYSKQLAQHAVLQTARLPIVANEIKVY
jgi:hypothetical protein